MLIQARALREIHRVGPVGVHHEDVPVVFQIAFVRNLEFGALELLAEPLLRRTTNGQGQEHRGKPDAPTGFATGHGDKWTQSQRERKQIEHRLRLSS